MKAARPRLSLKARAVQWLAQREHSRLELRRKLLARVALESRQAAAAEGADSRELEASSQVSVDQLLDELERQGLLSDSRFEASRVRMRAAKFGSRRIQAELKQQGVEISSSNRKGLAESEHSRAHALWVRRFGGTPASGAQEQARQARFLLARGFDAAVVARVVRSRLPDDEADAPPRRF